MSKNNRLISLGIIVTLCFGFGLYFLASSKPQSTSPSVASEEEDVVVFEEVEDPPQEQFRAEPIREKPTVVESVIQESEEQTFERTESNSSDDYYIANPEDVMQGEFLNQFMSDLTDEERTAIQLQAMQTSIEDRISGLAPGSLSEEELSELYDDIDFLNENNVFLGEEAEQLKIYARSMLEE